MRQAAQRDRRWVFGLGALVVLGALGIAWSARTPSASHASPPPASDFVGLGEPTAGGASGGRSRLAAPARPATFDPELLAYDAGCVDLSSAASLNESVRSGLGPLVAFDAVHSTPLDGGGQFWLVQDAYLNFTGAPPVALPDLQYTNNLAVVFDPAGCGTVLVRPPNENRRVSFEYGTGEVTRGRYFWPLGLQSGPDGVTVVWTVMQLSEEEPGAWEGIARHPVDTWIATYDPETFERLDFEPAPDPGVDPQWGFEMQTQGDWTYLFGNANLLNLARSGGIDNGPHPSTEMFVARVRSGAVTDRPAVWDGRTWSSDDGIRPASISTRGWFSNQMHPRRIGETWVSVTTAEEFWGNELVVDVASRPEGPWYEAKRIDVDRDRPDADQVSYHPTLLPVAADATTVPIAVSYNAAVWEEALADPTRYRPEFLDLDLDELRRALARSEALQIATLDTSGG